LACFHARDGAGWRVSAEYGDEQQEVDEAFEQMGMQTRSKEYEQATTES